MKYKSLGYALVVAATAALFGFSRAGEAASGYASSYVYLRAGPGMNYPIVSRISVGAPVDIHGCVRGWAWCDVSWNRYRGWVSGAYLRGPYHERRVGMDVYGPQIGLPIVVFGEGYGHHYGHRYRGDYWGHHR